MGETASSKPEAHTRPRVVVSKKNCSLKRAFPLSMSNYIREKIFYQAAAFVDKL